MRIRLPWWNERATRTGFLAVWLVLAGGGESAALDLAPYYPLRVGDVRLMAVSEAAGDQLLQFHDKELIASSYASEGREVFVNARLDTACWGAEGEEQFWDEEGLKYLAVAECEANELRRTEFDPPFLLLPRRMEPGQVDTWTGADGMSVSVALESVGEPLQVPAGSFTTVRLRWRITDDAGTSECTLWAASGLGVVRESCTDSDGSETFAEESVMVAAVLDGQLVGTPLVPGDTFSAVALALPAAAGCGLAVNDIVRAGPAGPELWTAQFAFDVAAMRWHPVAFAPGAAGPPVVPCALAGLDFASPTLIKVDRDNLSGLPQVWMRVPVQERVYAGAFHFDPDAFALDLVPGMLVFQ
jgi:hypothetical protein